MPSAVEGDQMEDLGIGKAFITGAALPGLPLLGTLAKQRYIRKSDAATCSSAPLWPNAGIKTPLPKGPANEV